MPLSDQQLLNAYETMILIRSSELKMCESLRRGDFIGHMLPCLGQEAIPAALSLVYDDRDLIITAHRGGGHYIARGCSLNALWAELYGRVGGSNRGRGGQLHLMDISKNAITGNAIVGTHWGLAAGAGFAARHKGAMAIAVGGEGSTNRGTFHESLNLAGVMKLPILYVVEYNGKQMWNTCSETTAGNRIADRARALGMPGVTVDGNDLEAIYDAALELARRIRAGEGPALLECVTFRWTDSCSNLRGFPEETEHAKRKDVDPVARLDKKLRDSGALNDAIAADIQARVAAKLAEALEFALASPMPAVDDGIDAIYSMPV